MSAPTIPAPAAPAAPVPSTPVPPIAPPPTAPFAAKPGATVQETVKAASEALKANPHHSLFQPRDTGKFAGPPDLTKAAAPGDPAAEPAPVDPEAAVDPEAPPAEPVPEEPPADLLVTIPGRQPGETLEIQAADPETAERLRQLANGYVRGSEVRQQLQAVQAKEAEVAEREFVTRLDPISVMANHDPPTRASLALTLLAQPGVFEAVAEELDQWADPNVQRARRAEIEKDYLTQRDKVREQIQDHRTVTRAVNEYRRIIDALIPSNLPEPQQALFRRDCLNDIRAAAANDERGFLHPRDVPAVLETRLLGFGMTPEQIAQALAVLRGGRGVAPGAAGKPAARPVVRPTGQQFVDGQKARAAAVAPSSGPGAPINRVQFNPNDTIADRIAAYKTVRQQAGS